MNKPLVTIVMPVYNVAPYIERALLSAIRQTYSNLEIILVDDCGKDDSIQIAGQIIAQYDTKHKVRIIHHDHNRGLSAARNTGLDNMKGKLGRDISQFQLIAGLEGFIFIKCIRCSPVVACCKIKRKPALEGDAAREEDGIEASVRCQILFTERISVVLGFAGGNFCGRILILVAAGIAQAGTLLASYDTAVVTTGHGKGDKRGDLMMERL